MSTDSDRREIYEKFKESKEYRDAFVAEHIYSRLPLKIRELREQRGWSQKDLGEKVGMAQAWVSKLEDPSYGKYTIATLLRLASAFDVGLDIDFKLFSQILDKALTLTPESFEVVSFTDDPGFLRYQASTAERSQDIGSSNRSHFSNPPHSNVPGNRRVKSGSPPGRIATIANTADTSVSLRPKDDKTVHERVEFGVYDAAGATV
jgi:transcriptional regulator with XRE-family HTH domain